MPREPARKTARIGQPQATLVRLTLLLVPPDPDG
jgi:hypothetical protein